MIEFKWSWCDLCEVATPHCPQCGLNSCSGGANCPMCDEVYKEWDRLVGSGEYPKTEEEIEIYNNKE